MGCNCKKKGTVQQPKVIVKPAQPKAKTPAESKANVASRNRRIIRRVSR